MARLDAAKVKKEKLVAAARRGCETATLMRKAILKEAYAYLAVRELPNGRKHVFVSGLDLGSKTVEGRALRRVILNYLFLLSGETPLPR